MARLKKFLDKSVLEAARERYEYIYTMFDSIVVQFSGGKDSLVCLHLLKQFYEQHGIDQRVQAIFRDEEIINDSVLEFVERHRHMDWLDLHWVCVPTTKNKLSLNSREGYVEWGPDREWLREMPDFAITAEDLGIGISDQHSLDDALANYLELKGKVAFITGIRAEESLTRFRSVTQRVAIDNYITNIENKPRSRVKLAKPIYDWGQTDVFLFLHENGIEWCPLYEAQELAGMGLRVSTPLHAESAKKFDKLAAVEPEFYQKVVDAFPEMRDQERYWKEFDAQGMIKDYADDGLRGVMRFITENIKGPELRAQALDTVKLFMRRHERDPEAYPMKLLLKMLAFDPLDKRIAGEYVNSRRAKERKDARAQRSN